MQRAFALCAHVLRSKTFDAFASVPIWSEQKGSWKAKILARLYYIRMFMRCPVPAGRRASALLCGNLGLQA